ncbi:DUF2760 domain-containing protein [Blastopirellula marina]|uniref:DUF2760 domain-containing protein n=1 Tax=Blastopirellula marina TaxID=124 RepID=A0A2S8GJ46_9BACT|nr:DUF2760 domain-containing protein [Blastopirellula marina]PQO44380.1 DUF2760 domain-containing protein [Blastopirellula marina]
MGRLGTAFSLFFKILFNRETAEKAQAVLLLPPGAELPAPETKVEPPKPAAPPKPEVPPGIDALVLLAALQREARFLDLFQEDLSSFADAQIGAAVRDVHRDTKATLDRIFGIERLRGEEEGTNIAIPADFNPLELRLVGSVGATPPASARLVHAGWRATKCELPKWNGQPEAAKILAPAEAEV